MSLQGPGCAVVLSLPPTFIPTWSGSQGYSTALLTRLLSNDTSVGPVQSSPVGVQLPRARCEDLISSPKGPQNPALPLLQALA